MALVIDGYNVIHAAGILSGPAAPGELERARMALLRFLADTLDAAEMAETAVVFDARLAPPNLPRQSVYRGISVYFSAEYVDADELIAELIRRYPSPKQLLVVSSDHAVQRAARRRKAQTMDADDWYFEHARRPRRHAGPSPPEFKPSDALSAEEVRQWLACFGGESILDEIAGTAPRRPGDSPARDVTSSDTASSDRAAADKPRGDQPDDLVNPFPAGYGEDLLESEN